MSNILPIPHFLRGKMITRFNNIYDELITKYGIMVNNLEKEDPKKMAMLLNDLEQAYRFMNQKLSIEVFLKTFGGERFYKDDKKLGLGDEDGKNITPTTVNHAFIRCQGYDITILEIHIGNSPNTINQIHVDGEEITWGNEAIYALINLIEAFTVHGIELQYLNN